jgi:hypothetical protein
MTRKRAGRPPKEESEKKKSFNLSLNSHQIEEYHRQMKQLGFDNRSEFIIYKLNLNKPTGYPYKDSKKMKQFKNYVSVNGTREELEAFAEELVNLGYTPDPGFALNGKTWGEWWDKWNDLTHIIINIPNEMGLYSYHNHSGECDIELKFTLPEQKEAALKAAAETL